MSKQTYSNKERKRFVNANRNAWNEVAPIHHKINQQTLLKKFSDPSYNALDKHCMDRLMEISIKGKSIAQVCCNNGIGVLSLKNLGAGKCVGFDVSHEFINQAKELALVTNHTDIQFVETDIYEIPEEYCGPYDLVMSTIGVLGWMPNLKQFFQVCGKLTKSGGHLFIEESHPVLHMYEDGENGEPSFIGHSYFKNEPWVGRGDLDYFENSEYGESPNYYFQHSLSEIMMAAIDEGYQLKHFNELDFDISGFCVDLEQAEIRPPLGMTMVWGKG